MATFWVEDGSLHAEGLVPGSIEDSIEKWEFLYNLTIAGKLVWDGGTRTCALCHRRRFYCAGCPIREFTGKVDCIGTPYEDYFEACRLSAVELARISAAEMVEFLEELLQMA